MISRGQLNTLVLQSFAVRRIRIWVLPPPLLLLLQAGEGSDVFSIVESLTLTHTHTRTNNQPPIYTAAVERERECVYSGNITQHTIYLQSLSFSQLWERVLEQFGSRKRLSFSLYITNTHTGYSNTVKRPGDGSFSFNCCAVSRTSLTN